MASDLRGRDLILCRGNVEQNDHRIAQAERHRIAIFMVCRNCEDVLIERLRALQVFGEQDDGVDVLLPASHLRAFPDHRLGRVSLAVAAHSPGWLRRLLRQIALYCFPTSRGANERDLGTARDGHAARESDHLTAIPRDRVGLGQARDVLTSASPGPNLVRAISWYAEGRLICTRAGWPVEC